MSSLHLISHNVNGIRAALHQGLRGLWRREEADILCPQEVRCHLGDLPAGAFTGHHAAWSIGELMGRDGVAVLTSDAPERVATLNGTAIVVTPDSIPTESKVERIGNRDLAAFADESRYVEAGLAGLPIHVASLYLPKDAVPEHHAWKPEEADAPKYEWKMKLLSGLARHLTQTHRSAAQAGREYVAVGDLNITNTRYDLKNRRSNQRTGGLLPEKRNWFTAQLGPRRLIDVIRSTHPDQDGPYSWWSWRGQTFTNDAGWRIDYHLATPKLAQAAVRAESLCKADYDSRISDRYPVAADYDTTGFS